MAGLQMITVGGREPELLRVGGWIGDDEPAQRAAWQRRQIAISPHIDAVSTEPLG